MRFKAVLETKGRDTGKMHRVWLLAVKYEGKLYFSRRNTNSCLLYTSDAADE